MNQFIQKKELFLKNPSYLLKVKKRFDMLKDKEEKTPVENRIYLVCQKDLSDGIEAINILLNDDKENLSNKINISNGELQILSIFFKLYFKNKEDIILLIDEPEISLSINWQEKLIPEMVNTEKCSLIIAMTHSPFIFKNEYFDKCTKEL